MIIDILTIFPNMLDAYIQESIIKRVFSRWENWNKRY